MMPAPIGRRRSDYGRTREVRERELVELVEGAQRRDALRMRSWPGPALRRAVAAVEAGDWHPGNAGMPVDVGWFCPDPSSRLQDHFTVPALVAEVERRGWPAVLPGRPRPFDPFA